MPNEETTAPVAKKSKIANRVYITPDGESRNAQANTKELQFRFADNSVLSLVLDKFPENIRHCLAWHGLSQKIGDSFAAAKGDVAAAFETASATLEVLLGGTWIEQGDSVGAAPSLIVEAIVRALTNSGEVVDETRENAIREKAKDKTVREGALKDPQIAAAYAAIKAERAADRAKELAKAAKAVKNQPVAGGF